MIKKIFNLIKKIIVAILLIYAYNKMTFPLDLFIPMNIFTILRSEQVGLLGVPASQYIVTGMVALPCRLIIAFLFNSNFFQCYYQITKCI